MNPNTDEFIQSIISKTKETLNEEGSLMPMFFVHGRDGKTHICALEIIDGHKEDLAQALRAFARSKGADWTLFLTECYMKSYDKDEDVTSDTRPVREREGRQEAVIFKLETLEGNFMAVSPIKFKADMPVLLEVKFEETEKDVGVFENLLGNKE